MRTTPLLTLSLLTACARPAPELGGQIGEEMPPPCVETVSELERDDAVALGFAPQEAVDAVAGVYPATLGWVDGAASALTLTLEDLDGEAFWVQTEPAEGGEPEGCPDALLVPVRALLQTDDGLLDEILEGQLRADVLGAGQLELAAEGLLGAWQPADGQAVQSLLVFGELEDETSTGHVFAWVGDAPDPVELGAWTP